MKHYLIGGIYFAVWALATILFASLVLVEEVSIFIAIGYYILALCFIFISIIQFNECTEGHDREIICFWARLFRKIGLRKLAAWYVALPEKRIQKLLNSK